MLLVLWAAIFIYAFSRRDRMLELMAFWVVITPLPLAFVASRGGACLYLPFFGWAMIVAKLVSDLTTLISKSSTSLGQAVRVRWEARAAAGLAASGKMSLSMSRVCATVLVASGVALFTQWENQRFGVIQSWLNVGQKTSHVIQAFRSLDLHPVANSMILLSPQKLFYQNGYYPAFVACLAWNDHSLQIYVDGQNQLTEQQIAKMNYIISFNEFQAKLLRAPESDHP
jgi:hypothetical protein